MTFVPSGKFCIIKNRITGFLIAFLFVFSLCACAGEEAIFHADFESGLGGFLIDNTYGSGGGLWHLSASCRVPLPGHTQGAALYYGKDATCNYDTGFINEGVVYSPFIDLKRYPYGPITLHFKYFLETELVNCRSELDPDYYVDVDVATVKISANGSGYVEIARNCRQSGVTLLASRTSNWVESVIDLSDYAGSVIRLRFGFDTIDRIQNYYEGFFVDDIVIYAPSCDFMIIGDSNHDCVVNLSDLAGMTDLVALAQNWLLNCYLIPFDPRCIPE